MLFTKIGSAEDLADELREFGAEGCMDTVAAQECFWVLDEESTYEWGDNERGITRLGKVVMGRFGPDDSIEQELKMSYRDEQGSLYVEVS